MKAQRVILIGFALLVVCVCLSGAAFFVYQWLGRQPGTAVSSTPSENLTPTSPPNATLTEQNDPGATQSPALPASAETRTYDITETIELTNEGPGAANRVVIWVALIQTLPPYQIVDTSSFSESSYSINTDEYENQYARIEITDLGAGKTWQLEFAYRVTVSEIERSPGDCSGASIGEFLSPEQYIESNAVEIMDLAEMLMNDSQDSCDTARSIYDYVGDNFTYSQYNAQDVGAQQALEQGSGDCTEFSDLYIALSRAAQIPAGFVEGVVCCTENGFTPGNVQHDWAEIYLPGSGWVPVDATLGRFPMQRELYFAAMTPDHIIVTRGRSPDLLDGYHYYYYRYWWDDQAAVVTSTESWSILPAQE